MTNDLDQLRRYAVSRTFFTPTTLPRAIARLGFVQADPLRAPARAQDLTLRHRVRDYRAGDLERRYPRMQVEEDFFINYGFLPCDTHLLLHPRTARSAWPEAQERRARAVLDFVRERGVVHPRDVDAQFQHGAARNWFGGSSRASTQLLDAMHYRGWLRVARREGGTRCYAVRDMPAFDGNPEVALDQLVDVLVAKYAPLPSASLGGLCNLLAAAAPQWRALRRDAQARARSRLARARIDGVDWFWPVGERPASPRHAPGEVVRLLAPFDPLVWDRRRFEQLWDWPYRFEAYTPAPKRLRGHYALPLLWRDQVIGWGNLAWRDGVLHAELGYVAGQAPADARFRRALADELGRMEQFLQPR